MRSEWSLQDERVVSAYWAMLDCGWSEETAFWTAQAWIQGRHQEIIEVLKARA